MTTPTPAEQKTADAAARRATNAEYRQVLNGLTPAQFRAASQFIDGRGRSPTLAEIGGIKERHPGA